MDIENNENLNCDSLKKIDNANIIHILFFRSHFINKGLNEGDLTLYLLNPFSNGAKFFSLWITYIYMCM